MCICEFYIKLLLVVVNKIVGFWIRVVFYFYKVLRELWIYLGEFMEFEVFED